MVHSFRCKRLNIILDRDLSFFSLGIVITGVYRYRLKICVPRKEAQKISKKTVETLKKVRCDEKLELFWKVKVTKKRRAPARIEECLEGNAAPKFGENIVSYYRKIYYKLSIV